MRISLNKLALPELGAFLSEWAASHDIWTPTQIDLSHRRDPTNPARYNVTILVTATYIAER